jgi:hypothetical protein
MSITTALVIGYAILGLTTWLILLSVWNVHEKIGFPKRHPDDQLSDFIMCVGFWPVSLWLVLKMARDR